MSLKVIPSLSVAKPLSRGRSLLSLLALPLVSLTISSAHSDDSELSKGFREKVHPFLSNYCHKCHEGEDAKAAFDLSSFNTIDSVLNDLPHWALILERLQNGDMPPAKNKQQPSPELRQEIVHWIKEVRRVEAEKNAGDPGPVPPRRLSNAEYDYTIRDLTGVDIRPTRAFPVDPANQAGFDNSAESLAVSPALVKKYLEAAREVAEHLVLQPNGFTFAPHPVVADTDRDKWAVFRIVEFYRRQPTDLAAYFLAAWRFQHRETLGQKNASLAEIAAEGKLSPKYLALIWSLLTEATEDVGPIAQLQERWFQLPHPGTASPELVAEQCAAIRDEVLRLRQKIVPEIKNLTAPPIHPGAQALVLWKNRQMAANRRRFDPSLLHTGEPATNITAQVEAPKPVNPPPAYSNRPRTNRVQAPTPSVVQRGGFSLPPVIVTKESSATAKMAALKNRGTDPELLVPAEPAERARYEAAFARFADIFPDAFYITERARVYLDAEKEQELAGRLLSAGLHSMTGYFRDDQPLYDLILDEAAQRELDRLWDEFEMVSSVPQRMHTSMVWFERTDSAYLRDPEFDPYRPEDQSIMDEEKIRSLAELYLAKARKHNASETAIRAIEEHFENVNRNIRRVEQLRQAAMTTHLEALRSFASRAYRRPLTDAEWNDLQAFYDHSRQQNGIDHEEAIRDSIARVLMSPNFLFRMDLVAASDTAPPSIKSLLPNRAPNSKPLSPHALASRLSYFLWASMPDEDLLANAASGDLHHPQVLKTQVRRMLQHPRVEQFATEFAGNWLDIRRFEEHNSVDRERYPTFNNELRRAMFEEPIRYFTHIVQSDRSVLDLIYGTDTIVNAALAQHYGFSYPSEANNSWVPVDNARASGRGGLFPMAVFLTANSPGLRTSPVKRGNWVVKRILGERIPPPPPDVPELPSDEKAIGELTLRQMLEKHRQHESCAGCHARFDSFGLVFEAYGPLGERRDRDFAGRPVDARAEFPNGSEGEGLEGLLHYIQKHREKDFVENFCRKLLAYALGRTLLLSDEPLLEEMQKNLARSEYRFSSIVETIISSPQFLTTRNDAKLVKH